MREAARYTITLFLSIVILALLVPSPAVKAQEIGVFPGKYLKYGTSDGSPWVTMDPTSAPPLSTWQTYMNFSTISFNITSTSLIDYTISFNESVIFRNDTKVGPFLSGFNIYSGTGGGVFFIASGLHAGSRVYPGNANNTYVINATKVDHAYWSGRTVCLLNYTTHATLENKSSPLAVRRTIIYWDAGTGVLLSAFEEAGAYDPKTNEVITGYLLFELIANNLGIPMDYPRPLDMTPIYIVIAISLTVALGAVIVRFATRTPKKKHKRLKQLKE